MMKKWFSVLLALMLALSCVGALAEEDASAEVIEEALAGAAEEAAAETTAVSAEPVLLVTVNGKEIYDTDNDFEYMQYYFQYMFSNYGYDVSDPTVGLYVNQLPLVNSIQHTLLLQKAAELGYDQISEEKMAELKESAATTWEEIVTDQMASLGITDESSEEDRTAARAEALAELESEGYTEEIYLQDLIDSEMISRIREEVTKDVTVSDEDVQEHFNALVSEDKDAYEGNVGNYEFATGYYGQDSYYRPEGYRGITHILLSVDETLLNTWKDLTARFEEQQEAGNTEATDVEETDEGEPVEEEVDVDLPVIELELAPDAEENAEAEETPAPEGETAEEAPADGNAEPTAEPTATPEPVTQEMIDAAKQAILDSVQAKVEEIMAKYEAGATFEELIKEYGTDQGMQDEKNLKEGYAVHPESILYDHDFVEGAMGLEKVGDVSGPIVSQFGVHILQYLRDIPGGAVELSDELKQEIRSELLTEAQQDAFNAKVNEWMKEADIRYTEAGEAWRIPEDEEEPADETVEEEAVEGEAEEKPADETADETPSEEPTAAPAE